jgi:AraC family transcriptional regulator
MSLRVRDLAAEAGVSPSYLTRIFVRAVGETPGRYMRRLRVLRARTLVRAGMPMARVARDTGFSSQSHMAREFTRFLGRTTKHFRKAEN